MNQKNAGHLINHIKPSQKAFDKIKISIHI